jgi:hypothetical protein
LADPHRPPAGIVRSGGHADHDHRRREEAVPSSDNMLQFGIPAFTGSQPEDAYLVDDITLEEG